MFVINKGLIIGVIVFCFFAFLSLAGASVYTGILIVEDEEFQKAMDEINLDDDEYEYDYENDDLSKNNISNDSETISDEVLNFVSKYEDGYYDEDESFRTFYDLYEENLVFYEDTMLAFIGDEDNPNKKNGSVLQKYNDELFDEEEKTKDKSTYDKRVSDLKFNLNKFVETNSLLLEVYGDELIDYMIRNEYHNDRETISQLIYYSIIPFENANYELPTLLEKSSEIHFNTFDNVSLEEREEINSQINELFSTMGNNYQIMLSLSENLYEYY